MNDEFGDIIDNFVNEYINRKNPVLCNTHIKWEALLKSICF